MSVARVIPEYRGALPRVSPLRGAMIQTGAMFVDAYRELNARKMFWIVLILSGLVVVAFAAVGINATSVTIFGKELGIPLNTSIISKAEFYKLLFNNFAVQWWLGWAAAILALISTAGIFPDLLTGGSVDLYLAKPISRLRLFLTKYVSALLFVALQVGVFTVASFFVIGIRGGVWLWGIYLAIPLVVCIFSYLYAVCTLLGVITRSTLAALLLTILVWLAVSIISGTDSTLLALKVDRELDLERTDARIVAMESQVKRLEASAATLPTTRQTDAPTTRQTGESFLKYWARSLVAKQEEIDQNEPAKAAERVKAELSKLRTSRAEMGNPFIFWHDMTVRVKTFLPKTSETLELLNRGLKFYADLPTDETYTDEELTASQGSKNTGIHRRRSHDEQEVQQGRIAHEVMGRSVSWVLGTSLAFEFVVLSIAAFIFVRRDY